MIFDTTSSRRVFIRNLARTAGCTALAGGITLSCEKEEPPVSDDLAAAYINEITGIIDTIAERETPVIRQVAALAVQARLQGHNLYSYMTGGMTPFETANGRAGNPHVFLEENPREAQKGDLIVTNDADFVRGLGERSAIIAGITSPWIVNAATPAGALENMGGFRIEDVADYIIYSHIPHTDGIVDVSGIQLPVFPASGIIHTALYYCLVAEITEGLAENGIYPRIG